MGAPAEPRASLAALAGSDSEQPGQIYFDEHQARWRWKSWRELDDAVRKLESARPAALENARPAALETAQPVVPSEARDLRPPEDGNPWPSPESLLAALALRGLGDATGGAGAALPPLAIGPDRAIAFLAAEPVAAEPAAWLAWALGAGAALVVPAAPELLAWSLAWTRPTHLALPAAELRELRQALLQLEKPRALRRRLRRLRHLVVWGAGLTPDAAEAAAWAELGVRLTPWPAEQSRPAG